MVLAGTMLLETASISLGLEALEGMGAMVPGVTPGWGKMFLAYRFSLSTFALLFAYHCFSWKEWARKGLVALIVVDLTLWLVVSAQNYFTTGRFLLDLSRMFLQISVVCFEVGLLWLLLDDHIKGEFHQSHDRTPSAIK